MGGIKRKSTVAVSSDNKTQSKKIKADNRSSKPSTKQHAVPPVKTSKTPKKKRSDDPIESDTSEEKEGFYGSFADKEAESSSLEDMESDADSSNERTYEDIKSDSKPAHTKKKIKHASSEANRSSKLEGLNATSSREAHAKQKALAKERKAAKPNADIIERTKKLWEQLRLKSHTDKDTRKLLVKELFDIITGRVKDFVFKHDSVRVIQCAIKYSTMEQRRMIARELKGEFKTLAEGKYSKFLIAKLLEKGDPEIRDLIISEFYGHVRRLINHPEAAWILDDTYRQVATPEQKVRLLREWYSPEYSIQGFMTQGPDTADLAVILQESPEKRKPVMEYLEIQINQIIQKKLTAFTMLHDAMLQYFLACKPGSSEANDFLEHLKPDPTLKEGEEADNANLLQNLAFTKGGSRLVSLAFAYGSAKDRKLFLRPYKDYIAQMAYDAHAHHVLLAALAVIDDTKLTAKSIFAELLPSNDTLPEKVLDLTNDARARTVLLYPFAADTKWLLDDNTRERLSELYAIRTTTSKKDPNTRLQEIAKYIEPQLLTAVTARAADFASFGFGLQFMGEVLVGVPEVEPVRRKEALAAVASLSRQILNSSLPASAGDKKAMSHGKNMLKTLVQGGKFDLETKKVVIVEPPLGFADMFWGQIKEEVLQWATGTGSFVIVGLLENDEFKSKDEIIKTLRKYRKELEAVAGPALDKPDNKKQKKENKGQGKKGGNAGCRILLEKL